MGRLGDPAAAAWGDAMIAKRHVGSSYHIAVVTDDALQGVTHVVRGQDLFWSTSVHRLLQALLGLPDRPFAIDWADGAPAADPPS